MTRSPSTTLTDHDARVAAKASAAWLLVGTYAHLFRKMIRESLADETGYEYAISLARPAPGEDFITAGPTRGNQPGRVGVHAPNDMMGDDIPDEFRGEVSPEPTHRYTYADLVMSHTHDTYDVPEVGLSSSDLTDKIPAGDELTGPGTPFDVYRAQSAVVFTDDEERLPLDECPDEWTREAHVFDERPDVRPWLHLVERTPAGVAMSRGEAVGLHDRSLGPHDGDTHAERFRSARTVLGDTVAELIVPLSP